MSNEAERAIMIKRLKPRHIEPDTDWRDAEIERLRAGIREMRDWFAKVAAYEMYFTEESFSSRRDMCDELLKPPRVTPEDFEALRKVQDEAEALGAENEARRKRLGLKGGGDD